MTVVPPAKTSRAIRLVSPLALAAGLIAGMAGTLFGQAPEEDADLEGPGYYQSYVFGEPDEASEAWRLSYGGRLYDRWWAVLRQPPPDGAHPSAPAKARGGDADSWRCVACHGWDYRGGDGRGGLSVAIDGAQGSDPDDVVARLRDEIHRFTPEMIPAPAAEALALFVTRGLPQPGAVIDRNSGRFQGDAERGRAIFQNVCAICHDYDGGAWISGEEGVGDSLGAIARNKPARALHKLINGQTYADMPAMRPFGIATAVDILTYVQTLEHED